MFRTFSWRALSSVPLLLACEGSDRSSANGVMIDADASVAPVGTSSSTSDPSTVPSASNPSSAGDGPTTASDAGVALVDAALGITSEPDEAFGADAGSTPPADAAASTGDVDILFDPEVVRRIDIRIPTDDGPPSTWELIDEQASVRRCEAVDRAYYLGAVAIDGADFSDVGVKTKGGCGSSVSLDQKASFKLHLSWDADPNDDLCPATRRYLGRKRLTLNNGRQDNTAMHEHLTFQFYRMAGVPAPKTAAAQVYVNDEYYGLYQLIEGVDRDFIERRFDTAHGKGMMYEGSYSCDFLTGNGDALADGGCWEREFELDSCSTPAPADDLQWYEQDGVTPQDPWQFAQALQTDLEAIATPELYYPAIEQWVAWDAFLVYWATSVVVVDWDNYTNWQNNFRFYHDPASDRWHWIPWGVDQTWITRDPDPDQDSGGRGGAGGPTHDAFSPRGDLARLCLQATGTDASGRTCTEAYVAALWQSIALFESVDWLTEIDTWQARLSPYMQLEGDKRSYSYEAWLDNLESLREFAATRAQQLDAQLTQAGYPRP